MKIGQVMHRSITSVTPDTPLKEAARLIFSLGISGIPVIENKKLVGIITEEDILRKMHPSIKELIEDYPKARSFEAMENNLVDILKSPVKKIMTKTFKTATAELPLMHAQSLMLLNKFSHLPVTNSKNELVGIISQGDIFRELIKNEIPMAERERYAEFVGRHYDEMVNWEKRLEYEFPILIHEFKKENISNILDLGIWTGEYSINLIKEGVGGILGLDHNKTMIDIANAKIKKLPPKDKNKFKTMLTDFKNFDVKINEKFDAAICMGNSLPYIPVELSSLLPQVGKVLRKKNAVIILQVLNFEKILEKKDRLLSFIIKESKDDNLHEHLFIEFFDIGKNKYELLHHVIVFDNDGKNWIFKGITTIPIYYYKKDYIEKELKKAGFVDITFSGNMGEYQGDYGQLSFTEPFDPMHSDWLNVLAVKK